MAREHEKVFTTTTTNWNFIRIVDLFSILAHENPDQKASLPEADSSSSDLCQLTPTQKVSRLRTTTGFINSHSAAQDLGLPKMKDQIFHKGHKSMSLLYFDVYTYK